MRSLEEINTEIATLKLSDNIGLFSDGLDRDEPKQKKRIGKRLDFLLKCRNYIETNPSEEFCHSEISRLTTLIEKLHEAKVPSTFFPTNFTGDAQKYREEKLGINTTKEQIKTIEFILGYAE